jgi:hypothetical protein
LRLFAANFLLDPRPWTLDRFAIATKRLKIHKNSDLKLYLHLQQKLLLIVFERPTNFIVVANFKENQLPLDGIKLKKQAKPCAALEKIQAEFPNASSPKSMRRTPCIQHGNQGFIHSTAILDW